MNKSAKFVLLLTSGVVLSSGVAYKISRDRAMDFSRYIANFSNDISDDDFTIVAHRGFSSLEVENTYPAICLASSKGYIDCIEIDARLTSDDKLILSHDNIIFKGIIPYEVSSLTFDEATNEVFSYPVYPLRDYMFTNPENSLIIDRNLKLSGDKYHLIGLSDALVGSKDKRILIDIKFNNDVEKLTEELVRELDGVDTSNIIIQSLNIEGIKYIKDHTNLNCLVLISNEEDLKYVNEFDNVGLKHTIVNYDLVDSLLYDEKKVAVWTINNSVELESLVSLLGDHYKDVMYITNYPDLVVTRLHEKQRVLEKNL